MQNNLFYLRYERNWNANLFLTYSNVKSPFLYGDDFTYRYADGPRYT